jgi:hypothetical protein
VFVNLLRIWLHICMWTTAAFMFFIAFWQSHVIGKVLRPVVLLADFFAIFVWPFPVSFPFCYLVPEFLQKSASCFSSVVAKCFANKILQNEV